MQLCRSITSWISHLLDCMGGCFGCRLKTPPIISVDDPSNASNTRGKLLKGHHTAVDFWSSSAREMDNSAVPFQKSMSTISTSYQTTDPQTQSATGSSTNAPDFVNQGLLLWNQTRKQWIGSKGSQPHSQSQDPKLCCNATYESLLGTNKPFPQPIPLSEMVDFLVDVWEQEGLYD